MQALKRILPLNKGQFVYLIRVAANHGAVFFVCGIPFLVAAHFLFYNDNKVLGGFGKNNCALK